jgi:hypothetical protein
MNTSRNFPLLPANSRISRFFSHRIDHVTLVGTSAFVIQLVRIPAPKQATKSRSAISVAGFLLCSL